ncbi:MAG: bifunctional DNA-formamidopyrimidine glycosylase/DNA-(apurinic or apyrimidinic site) lyase [Chloroflexia bacterium]|nr:bifunctional DNA-formamidopyrimidine glycosylase/DNA-(apurinic or apyrimidinic site) lyase [Chloroflexia bacterium]
MPELPEVETTARTLRDSLPGRSIQTIRGPDYVPTIEPLSPAGLAARLIGRRITEVGRRAKYLLLFLDNGDILSVHLRMSGRLFVQSRGACGDRHTRIILELDDGQALHFQDVRKFGRMRLLTAAEYTALDQQLGPEPLGPAFSPTVLAEGLARRARARLKPLLLDQEFLAGLGNIYADESLFRAGLHPLRQAGRLDPEEVRRLYQAIRDVLIEAIAAQGTTLSDGLYRFGPGQPGRFAEELQVYGQGGQPCPRCGAALERQYIGGRSSHFCPQCQR